MLVTISYSDPIEVLDGRFLYFFFYNQRSIEQNVRSTNLPSNHLLQPGGFLMIGLLTYQPNWKIICRCRRYIKMHSAC
jgi:hypothetical protein